MTGLCFWRFPLLEKFAFGRWVAYLYSFRPPSAALVVAPSQLSYLFVGHDRLLSAPAPASTTP